jgi:hypothetical protein
LYPLPRYEEDWNNLSDPSKRNELWNPVRFIPFWSDGAVFLSFGGEIPETYERFHNTNFGLSPDDTDGYLLQRYLFPADLHGGPRPVIDEDKLDLHQGFFDLLLLKPEDGSSLTLRGGRRSGLSARGVWSPCVRAPTFP